MGNEDMLKTVSKEKLFSKVVSQFLFADAIKYSDQSNLREKGLFWLLVPGYDSSWG